MVPTSAQEIPHIDACREASIHLSPDISSFCFGRNVDAHQPQQTIVVIEWLRRLRCWQQASSTNCGSRGAFCDDVGEHTWTTCLNKSIHSTSSIKHVCIFTEPCH